MERGLLLGARGAVGEALEEPVEPLVVALLPREDAQWPTELLEVLVVRARSCVAVPTGVRPHAQRTGPPPVGTGRLCAEQDRGQDWVCERTSSTPD